MSSEQKVAFITGGNRGIGLQTALDLGSKGVTIVIGARDPGKAEDAVKQLRTAGVTAEAIAYDAARPESDRAVYAHLEKKYGRLDILVNNAGTLEEPLTGNTSKDLPIATLRSTFDTNFFAVVSLTQTLLPLLEKAPAGRIVNLSSILGSLTLHSTPDSPIATSKSFGYNASKAALNAFTVHLAAALAGTKVKVNAAHPGWVKTPLGGPSAPMEVRDSSKTSVRLALLGDDGPTGGFFHENDTLPW
ncbi:MAG: short-chain dehydrogenase [Labilithrix sp.]|nr:short-chain dehydrogenase [Labilithrix sp.]